MNLSKLRQLPQGTLRFDEGFQLWICTYQSGRIQAGFLHNIPAGAIEAAWENWRKFQPRAAMLFLDEVDTETEPFYGSF